MILETFGNIQFESFRWIILLPVLMMAIDILTGLLDAWSMKNFQSAKMRSGLAKKGGELLILLIGILFTFGMSIPDGIIKGVSIYIIVMEMMSIAENLDQLGAPLPKFLKNVINNVGESVQNDDFADIKKKLEALEKQMSDASPDSE